MSSGGKNRGEEETSTASVLFDTTQLLSPSPDLCNDQAVSRLYLPLFPQGAAVSDSLCSTASHTKLLLLWLTLVAMDDMVFWTPPICSQRLKELERAGKTLKYESNWILLNQDFACPGTYI